MKFSRMREIDANVARRKTKRTTKKEQAELDAAKAKGQPPATPACVHAERDQFGMLVPRTHFASRSERRAMRQGRPTQRNPRWR